MVMKNKYVTIIICCFVFACNKELDKPKITDNETKKEIFSIKSIIESNIRYIELDMTKNSLDFNKEETKLYTEAYTQLV